jgi:hypothetical protein
MSRKNIKRKRRFYLNKLRNKNVLLAGATVLAFGVTSLTGMSLASAATTTSSGDSLVDKIASKFNLKKDDVQKVFDEDKTTREAERQKDFSDRLQKKVDNGDITAAQKTLIENKFKELQTKRDTEQKDLKKWASDNKIDLKYLHIGFRRNDDTDSSYLQEAIDNGDITAAQKTLIENKQNELKDKIDTEKTALQKWASDNKINLEDIMPLVMSGHGHEFGGPGMMR